MDVKVEVLKIERQKVDVTTCDFPGISEGKRDYLYICTMVDFIVIIPSFVLEGRIGIPYKRNQLVEDIEAMILEKITQSIGKIG